VRGAPERIGSCEACRYFTISNDSLHETVGAVDLAVTIGAMRSDDAEAVQALAVRIKPMLRGLMRSK
jgi:hypothetical protein